MLLCFSEVKDEERSEDVAVSAKLSIVSSTNETDVRTNISTLSRYTCTHHTIYNNTDKVM